MFARGDDGYVRMLEDLDDSQAFTTPLSPCIITLLDGDLQFHVFSKYTQNLNKIGNVTFYPINESGFLESIRKSYGVICNAGFQTSSEVIDLGKRLLVIPIDGQYPVQ